MKTLIAFTLMIGCTVAANLFMKIGATTNDVSVGFISRVLSWQVLVGLAFFGAAAIIYVFILTWLPLNVAQSFAAAQFVTVILASAFVLSEPINGVQWFGITFIAVGISIVGWSHG